MNPIFAEFLMSVFAPTLLSYTMKHVGEIIIINRPLAKIIRTDLRRIPQKKITLVGWAEDPVPSIEEKDFCKKSNIAITLLSIVTF